MMLKIIFLLFLSLIFAVKSEIELHNKPLVSIITSLYDGDEFIAGFLSDITRQTIFDQCELIIINANSPGNEEPIILEYAKKFPNIIYKKIDHDPGLYAVWNMAIRMAQADYITNANLDDRRNPESLEMQVRVLDQHPDIDLVYSDFYVTFSPNETFEYNTHQYEIHPDEFSPQIMYKCITGPQPMWRKNVHEKYGYFDESFKSAGDFEMWNRAASRGSKFKKIAGHSGLYYLNSKGLSTDSSKKDLQIAELHRINELYEHTWIAHYHYFCTAANSFYFPLLLNLIGSIHKTDFDNLGEIAIYDLGLTHDERIELEKIQKVSVQTIELVHQDLLKPFIVSRSGKCVPGWYAWKFVILKQALERYPYVLWVDAGTTILKPLNSLFKYIQQTGYFLCTMGDEKFYNQISHPIRWGATLFAQDYFKLRTPEKRWILDKEPLLSGTLGVSRRALDYLVMPLYNFAKNIRLFEDDGTTINGFGTGRHDQTVLSIFAYQQGLTVHQQDYTQQVPIYFNTGERNEEFYITWNGAYVQHKTHIYNSRWDMTYNFKNFIRYKN